MFFSTDVNFTQFSTFSWPVFSVPFSTYRKKTVKNSLIIEVIEEITNCL